MKIITAAAPDLNAVQDIVRSTIKAVYPHYYPSGAVEFFLAHHSSENILRDISSGIVSLAMDGDRPVGTVTVSNDEINRLFVLPEYQGKGFGRALMRFAESTISENYGTVRLDASLPAKMMYMKNGYMVIDSHIIRTDSGDFLCYDTMVKMVRKYAD